MSFSLCIEIGGARAVEAAAALADRLDALGYANVREHAALTVDVGAPGPLEPLRFDAHPNDPPEFAAEKMLDALAAQRLVRLEAPELSPEDEAALQARLRKLGYME
jgi:hypothetical protein